MPRVEGPGVIEREKHDPIPYFVVDLWEGEFDPAEFDRLAQENDHVLTTYQRNGNGQVANSRSYEEGDLDNPRNEVVAKGYLNFLVTGGKMYIFPEDITHRLFLSEIEGDNPDDAGSLLLQWKVGWSNGALSFGENINRTIFGYPTGMEVDPYGEFRLALKTLLDEYFVFNHKN